MRFSLIKLLWGMLLLSVFFLAAALIYHSQEEDFAVIRLKSGHLPKEGESLFLRVDAFWGLQKRRFRPHLEKITHQEEALPFEIQAEGAILSSKARFPMAFHFQELPFPLVISGKEEKAPEATKREGLSKSSLFGLSLELCLPSGAFVSSLENKLLFSLKSEDGLALPFLKVLLQHPDLPGAQQWLGISPEGFMESRLRSSRPQIELQVSLYFSFFSLPIAHHRLSITPLGLSFLIDERQAKAEDKELKILLKSTHREGFFDCELLEDTQDGPVWRDVRRLSFDDHEGILSLPEAQGKPKKKLSLQCRPYPEASGIRWQSHVLDLGSPSTHETERAFEACTEPVLYHAPILYTTSFPLSQDWARAKQDGKRRFFFTALLLLLMTALSAAFIHSRREKKRQTERLLNEQLEGSVPPSQLMPWLFFSSLVLAWALALFAIL